MKTHLSRGKHMLKCFAGKNNYFSCRLQVTEEANSSAVPVQGKDRKEKKINNQKQLREATILRRSD